MRRVGLPPGGSTLTTSAPRPASVSPQYSASSSASSTTRMPDSAPGRDPRSGAGSSFAAMVSLRSPPLEAVNDRSAGGERTQWQQRGLFQPPWRRAARGERVRAQAKDLYDVAG